MVLEMSFSCLMSYTHVHVHGSLISVLSEKPLAALPDWRTIWRAFKKPIHSFQLCNGIVYATSTCMLLVYEEATVYCNMSNVPTCMF